MKRGVATLGVVLAAFVVSAVALASHNPIETADPTGDSGAGPDISRVVVGNTTTGDVRFRIVLANRTTLAENDFVGIFIDTNNDPAAPEFLLLSVGLATPPALFRILGPQQQPEPVQATLIKTWSQTDGLTLQARLADIGNPTSFIYWVATDALPGGEDFADYAPDGTAVLQYTVASPHITSVTATFAPAAPRAGARLRVSGVTLALSSAERIPAATFRCRATLAGRAVRGTGRGGCTFSLPRSARGKRLSVTVTATLGSESRSVTRSFRVR